MTVSTTSIIVWLGLGLLFILYEGFALWKKEDDMATLSRTIWWLRDHVPMGKVLLFIFMVWLTIHFVWGPCSFGWC
jgi:hypothetical protein